MKIATLNFYDSPISHRDRKVDFRILTKYIKGEDLDILTFQEVIISKPAINLTNYFNPHYNILNNKGGLLVYSKLPIDINFTRFKHQYTFLSPLTFSDALISKGFQSFKFKNYTIINTHIVSTYLNTRHEYALISKQLVEISQYIKTIKGQFIILGDFNLPPNHTLMTNFINHNSLYDLTSNISVTLSSSNTNRRSFLHSLFPHLKDIRVDYILSNFHVNNQAKLIFHKKINGRNISDHYGVMIEI